MECAFPYDVDLDELVRAKEKANVEQILLNAPPGRNKSKGGPPFLIFSCCR